MPTPSYVTAENVKFDGTTQNAVVLSDTNDVRQLILWDSLSVADQDILDGFVQSVGGTVPVSGAAAAKASVNYGSAVGSTATGLFAGTPATAGRQDLTFTATAGATATGLANDATVYTATITVDGVAKAISVVGSDAQTFAELITEIQTDLGASATITAFSSTLLRIVSATTGASSTVTVTDGTLFAAVAGFTPPISAGPAGTNLVPATTYTAAVTIDGVVKLISVLGSAAQTFTTLVGEIATDVGAAGTVALTGGKIVITSATTGAASSVAVSTGSLFPAVAGFAGVTTTVGFDDAYTAFQTTRSPNGALYSEVFRVLACGLKPAVLPNTPHSIEFVYFDGSEWKYMDDDTSVCAV